MATREPERQRGEPQQPENPMKAVPTINYDGGAEGESIMQSDCCDASVIMAARGDQNRLTDECEKCGREC